MVLEYGLQYKDLERLKATLPTITDAIPISLITQPASQEERQIPNARILGITPEYRRVKNVRLRRGRFITVPDLRNTANVAVLGAGAAQRLFRFKDPIGQPVLLGEDVYRVIGVLASQSSGNATPGAVGQQDLNDDIYIPLSCAKNRFGEIQSISSAGSRAFERTQLNEITLQIADSDARQSDGGNGPQDHGAKPPQQRRFSIGHSLGTAAPSGRREANLEHRARFHRGHFPARRWDWNHEHHVGQCHRTNARDWCAASTRVRSDETSRFSF